jgi:hypothetical protein
MFMYVCVSSLGNVVHAMPLFLAAEQRTIRQIQYLYCDTDQAAEVLEMVEIMSVEAYIGTYLVVMSQQLPYSH